ncbi:hypothetical protein CWE04_11975 [Thomasclavelia cocleata]|uniref:Uncharacterized protein n=1 Tax=Thomasclavelia cocleata TaxID=69824 RepID=A0A1I0BP11_9FIRM|nr:hypothetical protein [Thomasclavelia cocleata]MCR1960182.1 hypothetical protein [Thomasclavelia cocleata]NDO41844.1 hypothetical protein [Thomasclavelia cocleata]PJN79920.1 hypothetical protein CWE04_11975 [Thomasclavelia cocleata]SET08039.1 hypothetical protein SAMN04489758_101184 [Thomasclavelia cocleata]
MDNIKKLQEFVKSNESLKKENYKEETWNIFEKQLNEANKFLKDVDCEASRKYTELVKVFVNLRLKPNKDLLANLINKK